MRVDAFDDRIPVPVFGPRMVSTSCGIVGAYVRSNWKERTQRESLTGRQWRQNQSLPGAEPALDSIRSSVGLRRQLP